MTNCYLSRIVARNLKGGDIDVALDRANVFHGDNWSLKTAVLDAARLVLVGHLHELGKPNQNTFGLCSGRELYVRGEFSDGRVVERTWTLRGDSVKMTTNGAEGLGDVNVLTVMLNAEAFFALGATDRERYVFANVPGDPKFTPEAIGVRVAEAAKGFDFEAVWHEAFERVDDEAAPVADVIATCLEVMREKRKGYDDHADRMQKTVQGLTHLRADDQAPLSVDDLKARRAELQAELDGLNAKRGERIAAFTKMTGDRQRRAAIERDLNHGEKSRRELLNARDLEALAVARLGTTPAVDHKEWDAAIVAVSDAAARVRQAAVDVEAAGDVSFRAEDDLRTLATATTCPFCGAEGEGWKVLKGEIYAKAMTDATLKVAAAMGTQAGAKDNLAAAQARHSQLKVQRDDRTAAEARLAEARATISRLGSAADSAARLQQELAGLSSDDPALTAEVESLQTRLNVTNQEARGLDTLIERAGARGAELQRLAQAETDRDAAIVKRDLVDAAGKELAAIRAEAVNATFQPVVARANEIFGDVLPSPLAFKAGEVGTWRAGAWVGHKTFSGAERALAYAAVQAALASLSPVKVMLLDELGRLTAKNAERVAERVLTAIDAGWIDQFLGVDPERTAPYDVRKIASGGADLAFKQHGTGV